MKRTQVSLWIVFIALAVASLAYAGGASAGWTWDQSSTNSTGWTWDGNAGDGG
jgi:hypothetical protein